MRRSRYGIPRNAVYRARLPIRKGGYFSHYSTLTYYFDEDMKELGYTVKNGPFLSHTAGREWSDTLLCNYEIQRLGTNEVVQEGRRATVPAN